MSFEEEKSKNEIIEERKKQDQKLMNFLLALLFSIFIILYLRDIITYHKLSSVFMLAQVSASVTFFLLRAYPKKTSTLTKDWILALLGTWLPVMILPTGLPTEDHYFLLSTQILGVTISTLGLLSLNKSLGIVPSLREIKTYGLYRFIRHPIYLGYFFSLTSITLQNLNAWNVFFLVCALSADIFRIKAEETFLSQDEAYLSYSQKVKWRLIPFVW